MCLRVASRAEADQIAADQRELRMILQVLDVMHGRRLPDPPVSLAFLAAVTVTPEDHLPLMQPLGAVIELIAVRRASLLPGKY
jgi:hypothetical protein